ncbi:MULTISPECIES: hypothetical protein [Pseudonocardia]|uniref:hypothetical protein n=1 Tax=Pseudonocardia TaxID=1847 RepID=UPI0035A253F6
MGTVLAATWVWVGMVLAISFIEAPLKFRAPGITTVLGLGIGRLVFRALNIAELVLLRSLRPPWSWRARPALLRCWPRSPVACSRCS